jgi:hypothetical protein
MDTLIADLIRGVATTQGAGVALIFAVTCYMGAKLLRRGDEDAAKLDDILGKSIEAQIKTAEGLKDLKDELHQLRLMLTDTRRRS